MFDSCVYKAIWALRVMSSSLFVRMLLRHHRLYGYNSRYLATLRSLLSRHLSDMLMRHINNAGEN